MDVLTLQVPLMTCDELIAACGIRIHDDNHYRVTRLFHSYCSRVGGKNGEWAKVMETILGVDFANVTMTTGCFNGVNDGTEPPYGNPDCYIKMSDGTRVYIYGAMPSGEPKQLKDNDYVLFVLSDTITDNIERRADRHIFMR
jgi:hypothetical protein